MGAACGKECERPESMNQKSTRSMQPLPLAYHLICCQNSEIDRHTQITGIHDVHLEEEVLDLETAKHNSLNALLRMYLKPGWRKATIPVPGCFVLADSFETCVIERLGHPEDACRVVVIFPNKLLDRRNLNCLLQDNDLSYFCKPLRVVNEVSSDRTFVEFQYPGGVCLEELMRTNSLLSENEVISSCRSVYQKVVLQCKDTPLRCRGLFDATDVYVDPSTKNLTCLMCMGWFLSCEGIHAISDKLQRNTELLKLAPELAEIRQRPDKLSSIDPDSWSAIDSFSIARAFVQIIEQQLACLDAKSKEDNKLRLLANDLSAKFIAEGPCRRLMGSDVVLLTNWLNGKLFHVSHD